jgi:hypothetical protein
MTRSTNARNVVLRLGAVGALLLLAGCRETNQDFGYVTGTVTLDGNPLAKTRVEFQPQKGPPSYGITDKHGVYELMVNSREPGAKVGRHTVRITTVRVKSNDPHAKKDTSPERIPAMYNIQSSLSREVRPGANRIDFDLTNGR